MLKFFLLIFCIVIFNTIAIAQDNYEIQVYASPTQSKSTTMIELHSNFTFNGQKNIVDGVYPSNKALHETIEITTGITNNFEMGFYLFTNYTNRYGYKIIGTHIRPRVRIPEKWHWPVGVSLSTEVGFQSRQYASDTWSLEIRPIIDKQFKKLYLSFNPTFGFGLNGSNHVPSFQPNIKAAYSFCKKVDVGFEYYGSLDPINNVPAFAQQSHAIFLAADLDVDPKWEINFAPGWGLTKATDGFVFKVILGRRISWKKVKK